jgi:DNA-binding transcriptional regulator YbjK
MTQTPPRSTRTEELLEAALHVVADQGLRGLSHRAVDQAAGLPEGSCSAYLRTRRDLVLAVTAHVAERAAGDVRELSVQLSGANLGDSQAIETVTRFFIRWIDERELLVARMELTLQSSRDAEIAAALGAHRRALVQVIDRVLAARGKEHTVVVAEALVASFDGILFGALPRAASQRRGFVRSSIEVLMAGLG